jgi:hypothetical protein
MMFFDHSDDFLTSYFSEWIGTKELAFFDTALCCKPNRTHFIALVGSDSFILRNMEVFSDCFYLDWIVLRKIKLSAIMLQHSDFYNLPDFVYQMRSLVKLQSVICVGLFHFLWKTRSITTMNHLYLEYSEIDDDNNHMIISKISDSISKMSCLRFLSLPGEFKMTEEFLEKCLHFVPTLESLEVGRVDSSFPSHIADHPNLTDIDCKWDYGRGSTLRPDFTTKNRSLRKIVMEGCLFFDDELFLELVNSVSNLFHFDISLCNMFWDNCVKVLMDNSPKIRFLRLVGAAEFLLSIKSVVHIARSGGSLTSLHLPGCDVTDEGLVLIGIYCIHLTAFTVSGTDSITDGGISFILKNCTLLQSLDVCNCELLTNSTAELFLKPGREFTDFDFRNTGITLECILSLVLNPEIKIVNVEIHQYFCGPQSLVSSCVGGLSRVDLHDFDREFEITHLVTLLKGCHNLQRLKLSGFDQLLDEHLLEIVKTCCELTHINIENNEKLTARSIKHVYRNCFQLRSLKVNKMMDLSDDDVANLTDHISLRHLSVESCKSLTDELLLHLTFQIGFLKSLVLSDLPLITDEGVCTLIEKQGMVLEHLNLTECNLLTSKVIETLRIYGSKHLKRNVSVSNTMCLNGVFFAHML